MNKYINADKLKEVVSNRLGSMMKEKVCIIIDELSEEREDDVDIRELAYKIRLNKWGDKIGDGIRNTCRENGIIEGLKYMKLQQPNPLKVAIKGDGTEEYGKKIIEYFENHNVSASIFNCMGELYYFACIKRDETISVSENLPEGYTEISLKEDWKIVTDNSKVNTYLLNRVEELEKELIDLKLKLKELSK